MSDASRNDPMHDRVAELLEGYVLGALDPPEAALVDQHLEDGCEDCEEEVGVLRRVGQLLPLATRVITPAGPLRARVLAAATQDASASPASAARPPAARGGLARWAGLQSLAAGVAVLAAAGFLGWAIVLQSDVDDLEQRAAAAETDARVARAIETTASAQRGLVRFAPMSDDTDGSATLVWDPDTEWFALALTGMPPTGDDAYVCWAHTRDGDIPLAHVYVRENGTAIVEGATDLRLADVESMHITHEADPEADRPSGAVVFTFDR
jgi:hypothetical protein